MKPLLLSMLIALVAGLQPGFAQPAAALAAPAPASAPPIAYPSVAAALQALQAQDGVSTIVTHSEGWVVVNEPGAAAQWSFVPKDHAAYPAVVRRMIRRLPDGDVAVDTSSLCEAGTAACARLLQEFNAMNERIREAKRTRGPRQVSPE
jgi:hypothetical protein